MKQYTVLLWPGAGYILLPFEVNADSIKNALYEATKRALDEEYYILGFEYSEEKINDLCTFYEKEMEEYEDKYDFITQYLNYYLIDELNYYINMDNTKVFEGWNLYENSIPLEEEKYLQELEN